MTSNNTDNCQQTIRDMYVFLDDELPAEVSSHIRDHLGGCSDCLEAFDFEAELKAAIRRKCYSDQLPPGLVGRIEACLDTDLRVGDDQE